MIVVRPVEVRDADAWAGMRQALWPQASHRELRENVDEFFNGKSLYITAAFIAEDNGRELGFIELNLRPYAEGAEQSPVPHVEGWYVVTAARRRGIGRKLLTAAEEWALAHGYSEMTSDTTDAYPLSIPAYAANGFVEVERLIAFHKKLR